MDTPRIDAPARLDEDSGRALYDQVAADPPASGTVTLDLSETEFMDSRGGAWLVRTGDLLRRNGAELRWDGAQGQVEQFMELVGPGIAAEPPAAPADAGYLERTGDTFFRVLAELRDFANLTVDAVYWTVIAPFEGRGLRVDALFDELHEMGVRAVKINFVMNFLLGLIIAMMSAAQLRSFGLDIYVASLVVIAFARELAAIMTAIIVSARTGAAIAAELANMKVQEEIDALRGMGLSVPQFLVAPKLLALLIVQPLLTALGMVAGVIGGTVWGNLVLGHRLSLWFQYTLDSATLDDIFQGLFKSFFFAVAIVLIGCHNGMRVKGGSRGVGLMTTRAVVMDIFAIIVIDMVFALLLYYVLE